VNRSTLLIEKLFLPTSRSITAQGLAMTMFNKPCGYLAKINLNNIRYNSGSTIKVNVGIIE